MSNPAHRDTRRLGLANDETGDAGQDVPEFQLDPYELAYLRGGSRELLTLHLFELVQNGYLIVIEKKNWFTTDQRLVVAPDLSPSEELTEIGGKLLEWFSEPQTARNIFDQVFPMALKADCLRYRANLLERRILTGWLVPESKFSKYWPLVAFSGFILVIIASGSLDFSRLTPVGYWVIVVLFGSAIYYFSDIRLTAGGKRYLRRIQNQLDHLRDQTKTARLGISEPTHLMAVAVFGTAILAGSSYDAFAKSLGDSTSGGYGIETGGGHESSCGG